MHVTLDCVLCCAESRKIKLRHHLQTQGFHLFGLMIQFRGINEKQLQICLFLVGTCARVTWMTLRLG